MSSGTYDRPNERCMVFYKDGMFLYTGYRRGQREAQREKAGNDYVPPLGGSWGSYQIVGDTIKGQWLDPPTSSTRFAVADISFKIIDHYNLSRIPNLDATPILYSVKYIPSDSLPDPNESWLKRKKWFWCDKEAYKQWKKSRNK